MWNTNLEKNPNQKIFIESFLKFNLYKKINIIISIVMFIFLFSSARIEIFDLISQNSILIHQPATYNSCEHCGRSLISHLEPQPVISFQNILLSPELNSKLLKIPSGNDLPQIQSLIPFLKSSLKPHQKQGLAFLLDREAPNGKLANSLWLNKPSSSSTRRNLIHSITKKQVNNLQDSFSHTPLGCLLEDDMGLGKSIQCISLICMTLEDSKRDIQPSLHFLNKNNTPNS
ncbi:hypothetical protein O181_070958 [Austropuccinia psidii MF-1]|uniref:SNF2 N-terminal domain-containing protein n=1 Tax=Austropuccinia psidii MF-1 TaxID=1389203 RepID=A0A9Q3F054_9BASI|nr:hypothetical protein [Austropuccinia psidii MF-1]